jgi:hypothetical protein
MHSEYHSVAFSGHFADNESDSDVSTAVGQQFKLLFTGDRIGEYIFNHVTRFSQSKHRKWMRGIKIVSLTCAVFALGDCDVSPIRPVCYGPGTVVRASLLLSSPFCVFLGARWQPLPSSIFIDTEQA